MTIIEPLQYDQSMSLPHDIFVNMKIYVSKDISFKFIGDDKLFSYVGSQPSKDKIRPGLNKRWHDGWMKEYYYGRPLYWWSAQLAAAIYIAATACDIDKYALTHPDPLIRSFYIFHVYYTVRKVLYDCQLPIPGDRMFDAKSNGTRQQMENLRQMLKHYGNPPDLKKFLLADGPDGLVWDPKTEMYSYRSKKTGGGLVLLDETEVSYMDYTSKGDGIFSGLAESARKTFHTGDKKWRKIGKRHHPDFESDIKVDQLKWIKLISDGFNNQLRPTTEIGKILVNKSIMVYFYSIIAAQTSYGGWSEATRGLIQEAFAKNVNSFTTNEPRFETRDLNEYYKFAKLNSRTLANFSLGEGYLLLPRDMRLKQTETSKKVYNVDVKNTPVSDGVSTSGFKPVNHNKEKVVTIDKHIPIKKKEVVSNERGLELILAAGGVVAAYLLL